MKENLLPENTEQKIDKREKEISNLIDSAIKFLDLKPEQIIVERTKKETKITPEARLMVALASQELKTAAELLGESNSEKTIIIREIIEELKEFMGAIIKRERQLTVEQFENIKNRLSGLV